MLRLLTDEFEEEIKSLSKEKDLQSNQNISIATGHLAFSTIRKMTEKMMETVPGLSIEVYPIRNNFFGEMITVSGLLTGEDLAAQLSGKNLGNRLLLPQNILRSGEEVFLDDMTLSGLEKALQVKIDIVKSSGRDFVDTVLNR